MSKEIAVLLGEDGETISIYEGGRITVWEKKMEKWCQTREKEFRISRSLRMIDLRKKMEETVDFLGNCRIFVAASIEGLPYFVLDKARCSILECQGSPQKFLDYILEIDEMEKAKNTRMKKYSVEIGFEEILPGSYRIDLKKIQENNLQALTKQVLLPFLRKGNFSRLEVICHRIPRWLEREHRTGNFYMNVSGHSKDQIRVVITKST